MIAGRGGGGGGCRNFNYLPFLPPTTLLNGTALISSHCKICPLPTVQTREIVLVAIGKFYNGT